MIDNNLLVHELQLGESLNHCVHNERRADFALMLAMLVDDVREFSQFKLPLTESNVQTNNEAQLRRQFELPPKAKLALDTMSDIIAFDQGEAVHKGELADIRLESALSPRPLAFRDDKSFIPTQIQNNTTLYCQSKHNQPKKEEPQRLSFNANEWLKSVQNTRLKNLVAAA